MKITKHGNERTKRYEHTIHTIEPGIILRMENYFEM
jgi:hypothetical protein